MEYKYNGYNLIAGCDEAGRGCLAGPVVAAAVVLPNNIEIEGINDSKKLTPLQRLKLRDVIINTALDYAIALVDNDVIDEINILNASILAMHKSIEQLKTKPDILLIDGNRFKQYKDIPHECVIKGDSKYAQIAAASILAKTYRDELMTKLSAQYPHYEWNNNKGYPTQKHVKAILSNGLTPLHRKTFSIPKLK